MKSYHRKFFFACQNKSDTMQNPEIKFRRYWKWIQLWMACLFSNIIWLYNVIPLELNQWRLGCNFVWDNVWSVMVMSNPGPEFSTLDSPLSCTWQMSPGEPGLAEWLCSCHHQNMLLLQSFEEKKNLKLTLIADTRTSNFLAQLEHLSNPICVKNLGPHPNVE